MCSSFAGGYVSDLPVKECTVDDACPAEATGFLALKIFRNFLLSGEDWDLLDDLGVCSVAPKLAGDESLHSCFDCDIDENFDLANVVGADGQYDGVLSTEGGQKLVFRVTSFYFVDFDVRGIGGFGAFAREDRHGQVGSIVQGFQD